MLTPLQRQVQPSMVLRVQFQFHHLHETGENLVAKRDMTARVHCGLPEFCGWRPFARPTLPQLPLVLLQQLWQRQWQQFLAIAVQQTWMITLTRATRVVVMRLARQLRVVCLKLTMTEQLLQFLLDRRSSLCRLCRVGSVAASANILLLQLSCAD